MLKNIEETEKQFEAYKALKEQFGNNLLDALKEKSVKKLNRLSLQHSGLKIVLGSQLDIEQKEHDDIVLQNCKTFLDSFDRDITLYTLAKVALYYEGEDIDIESNDIRFLKSILVTLEIKDEPNRVSIDIDSPIFLDKNFKINNPLMIKSYSYEEKESRITDTNRYKLRVNGSIIEIPPCSLDEVEKILKKNGTYSDGGVEYNNWYIYDGDLELDEFIDVDLPLVVTGDLTIRSSMVELHTIIVLGKTKINSATFDDQTFLFGGIEFNIALFIPESGTQILLKNPCGPFIFSRSETAEIKNKKFVKYYFNKYEGEIKGDGRELIKSKYFYEDDGEEDDDYNLDNNLLYEDIKIGKMVFNNEEDIEKFIEVVSPILSDKKSIVIALKKNPMLFKTLSNEFREDKELIDIAVKEREELFAYIGKKLKKDRDFIFEQIKKNWRLFRYVDTIFKKNKELLLIAINLNFYALSEADDMLKDDKEVVLYAINKDARALEYASKRLKADREILFKVIEKDIKSLKYASDDIVNDRELMLAVVRKDLSYLDVDALKHFRQDKDFIESI